MQTSMYYLQKRFRSWKEQAEHWKHKHTDKDQYQCKECNKEFGQAVIKNICCSTRRKRKRSFVRNVDNVLVTPLN